ncbi:hypothetical protein ACOMHN_017790 [Nucella lapillus]
MYWMDWCKSSLHNCALSALRTVAPCLSYAVPYICKYVNKGSDQATFSVQGQDAQLDEISNYQEGHYICTSEAVWRILNFHIHERFSSVMTLDVHLENGERVYFT